MKYFKGYLSRWFDKLFMLPLAIFEYEKLMSNNRKLKYPPIFIVGPPRSGTTLLYQLMVHHFHLAYFTNIADRFYTSPVMMTKLASNHFESKPYISDFTSSYGVSQGWMAPHEAGNIWNRWYPTENKEGYNYTSNGYLNDRAKHIIYQTVSLFENIFHAPFINKNTKNSVRIRALNEIFTNSLFIQIRRNPFDIANSILNSRKKKGKSINDWWSTMPKEINQLRDKNYLEQICGQIFYIEKNIEDDIRQIGIKRLKVVHYEELCKDPLKQLDEINSFMSAHGCHIQTKHDVPKSFPLSEYEASTLTKEQEIIKDLIHNYYGTSDGS